VRRRGAETRAREGRRASEPGIVGVEGQFFERRKAGSSVQAQQRAECGLTHLLVVFFIARERREATASFATTDAAGFIGTLREVTHRSAPELTRPGRILHDLEKHWCDRSAISQRRRENRITACARIDCSSDVEQVGRSFACRNTSDVCCTLLALQRTGVRLQLDSRAFSSR